MMTPVFVGSVGSTDEAVAFADDEEMFFGANRSYHHAQIYLQNLYEAED